jgi:hypothetical protein
MEASKKHKEVARWPPNFLGRLSSFFSEQSTALEILVAMIIPAAFSIGDTDNTEAVHLLEINTFRRKT